jgi:hypothetical protein
LSRQSPSRAAVEAAASTTHFGRSHLLVSGPRTLEVVRCHGFEPGAREARKPDGSVQLRLPFGSWIVALKSAEELAGSTPRY